MLGLDYSSSDDNEDEEQVVDKCGERHPKDNKLESTNCLKVSDAVKSMANPFEASNYELSSDSDNDKELAIDYRTQDMTKFSDNLPSVLLPKPIAVHPSVHLKNTITEITGQSSKVSIFSNPFKEEEMKEMEQLERHVKMSDNTSSSGQSSSDPKLTAKKICWNYHKHKKCKFGNRCRFRHEDDNFIDVSKVIKTTANNSNNNKKRVGLTDDLIPPKKALMAYYNSTTK
ncbi:uncharacterized protein LOC128965207 [Oppia nitens]|uniref:uncharacterized protein LOC128965207 n=1 Tax=Oppia nitens TaxID=1686743 RepID=UPI0023DC6FEC|nr:uncharacterized protein LOC128965207 [Oppia nitens]